MEEGEEDMRYFFYTLSSAEKEFFWFWGHYLLGWLTHLVLRSKPSPPFSGSKEIIFLCKISNFTNGSSKNINGPWCFSGCRLFKLPQLICITLWIAGRWGSGLLEFHSPIQIGYPIWYTVNYQEVNKDRNMNYSLVAKDDCCISDQTAVVQATFVFCSK